MRYGYMTTVIPVPFSLLKGTKHFIPFWREAQMKSGSIFCPPCKFPEGVNCQTNQENKYNLQFVTYQEDMVNISLEGHDGLRKASTQMKLETPAKECGDRLTIIL